MNAAEALGRLRRLHVPAATTADAAALFGVSVEAASHTLRRLAGAGLVKPVRKGLWALAETPDPLQLAGYVTAPYPCYVSLQTALYRRGMIEQIPSMIFLVSLARSARIATRVGTFSVHHVPPEFFGGYEQGEGGAKIAEPEKALVDVLYLSPTRGRLFAALPELELPDTFSWETADAWAARIPSARMRTIVERKLEALQDQDPDLFTAVDAEGWPVDPARKAYELAKAEYRTERRINLNTRPTRARGRVTRHRSPATVRGHDDRSGK